MQGCCLTVVELQSGTFLADVSSETLRLTTLGQMPLGARVNLEPALKAGDALGGHLLSGHVDGLGQVVDIAQEARSNRMDIALAEEELARYVARKGSIAVDGVSLSIADGEFFGIVGRNGSGKSTLLKCLAGIYEADDGYTAVQGRLSPFIQLGVGFNPELAARDNVILNSIMLGLGKREALDKGVLSVHAVGACSRIKMLWLVVRALFRKPEQIDDFETQQVTEATGLCKKKHLVVALDGEVQRMKSPLSYRIRPGALVVRRPPREAVATTQAPERPGIPSGGCTAPAG